MNGSNIRILKLIVDNTLIRFFLSHLGYCKTCEQFRMDVVIDLYVRNRNDACSNCLLTELLLSMIIRSNGHFFGVDKQSLKQRFKDSYWKKGLINVLSRVSKFGIHKPFIPGTPFLVVWDDITKCHVQCDNCYFDSVCIKNKKEHQQTAQKISN